MYFVKPVFAEMKDEGGVKRFFSDYSFLEVARVKMAPPDTSSKIFDIAAPYRAPLTLGELLPWILLVLLVSLIIWLIYQIIKENSERNREAKMPGSFRTCSCYCFP